MKKIIFVLPRMGGGGAERVTSLLANELSLNNEVTVYTFVGGESFYYLNENVHYENIGITMNRKNKLTRMWSKTVFFPKTLCSLYKKLKKGKYDVVVSLLNEADILVGICRGLGVKFKHICSERNDPTKRSSVKLRLLNTIYKRADLFVCQGQRVCDFYKNVPFEKKIVIPNPVNGERLPVRLNETKRIVAVGRLDKQKNFTLLIESFKEIGDEFPDYRLDIYGEGTEREKLEKLIQDNNLQENVFLKGAHRNVQQLIADAALFIMSSDYEGFPNALLEAMAIGLPVISTDFPTGIASELISAENGLVVPVNDKKQMVQAMKKLLNDSELREIMGKNNREKCKEYYIENIIYKWTKAISELVKG